MASKSDYQEYHLLSTHDDADVVRSSLGDRGLSKTPFRCARSETRIRLLSVLVIGVLMAISFSLGYCLSRPKPQTGDSQYMKLSYDQPSNLWWNTEFSSENASESELNELWDIHIPWESGIIALTNEEAQAMNLPESQPFPWDASGKRIYIVNAHHILHCVRNLYISINQYRTNKLQTINYPHILHCLDSLRVETMCTADDTLRYVPLNAVHGFRPGDGQTRKCRDWNQVQQFVNAHDPCYHYLKPGDNELSNLERFKYCPKGSPYLPKIRDYFGYRDDWSSAKPEGPRELEW
ncbi:hypothetical protein F4779DRAFT_620067 [Xylariaceae sp. FL0662B]|nr:hypothetical protein F4779DRAFT_620067 [Xylariaceae sp. FL0662B]